MYTNVIKLFLKAHSELVLSSTGKLFQTRGISTEKRKELQCVLRKFSDDDVKRRSTPKRDETNKITIKFEYICTFPMQKS